MATIACYIKELDNQRDKLADNLVTMGVLANHNETYNSLVAKVLQIPTSEGKNKLAGIGRSQLIGVTAICGIAEEVTE